MEKKKVVKLLAIQVESAIGNLDLNVETVENMLRANIEKYGSVDFIFLPELWTVGWDCPSFTASAEALEDSKAVGMLKSIAKEYQVNILGGSFVRKDGNKLFNTCPVVNRNGEVVCLYDKNHLYSYNGDTENSYITVGKNPVMVEIEGVKFGISICYDIRFPEIYRAYKKAGADILVNMAAWPKSRKVHWDTLAMARAIENQSYMVALTQTGLLADGSENLGHSMIIDYNGKILCEIDEIEGGIYTEIDLEKMYEFRDNCNILNDIKSSYEVINK